MIKDHEIFTTVAECKSCKKHLIAFDNFILCIMLHPIKTNCENSLLINYISYPRGN